MRPTWVEISLSALRRNFRALCAHVGPAVEVCAVLKADAYGHGAPACGRALQAEGARWIGVTSTEEGLALRSAGVTTRILLMTGFWRDEEQAVLEYDLTPAVFDWWQVGALEEAAPKLGRDRVPVHIKVDTGMARLGVPMNYLEKFAQRVAAAQPVVTEGLMTHLAASEVLDDGGVEAQLRCFQQAQTIVTQCGLRPALLHAANSAALAGRPNTWGSFVRPGLALYGYSLPFSANGSREVPPALPLEPALTWKTRIMGIREVAAGQALGYNATYIAREPARIAALPVGYADGLSRQVSSCGRVIVRDHYAPIVGLVSMDITLVDVTAVPGAALGDEVILLGSSEHCRVDAWDHARWAGTVPYEILCAISKRVPRRYVD